MPIRWSSVKVNEAMDEVEHQISLAEAFLTEARARASNARAIANLPGYIDDRISRLIWEIERIERIKDAIKAVRSVIPEGAIEVERERLRHGSQQTLI